MLMCGHVVALWEVRAGEMAGKKIQTESTLSYNPPALLLVLTADRYL